MVAAGARIPPRNMHSSGAQIYHHRIDRLLTIQGIEVVLRMVADRVWVVNMVH